MSRGDEEDQPCPTCGRTPYGIPEFLSSTWETYGGKPTDPREQIRLGLQYIRDRYGNGWPK